MNLLIFDNSPFIRKIFQTQFSSIRDSLNIILASSMNSVNDMILHNLFDIVILDMDYLDGKFNHFMKIANEKNPDMLIVLLTAFPYEKIFQIFKNKGVDYCFDKTQDYEKLISLIDNQLDNKQSKKVVG